MLCSGSRIEKKKRNYFWIVLGLITVILGVVLRWRYPDASAQFTRGAGMLSGFGTGIIGVAVVRMLQDKFSSKEKMKDREIRMKDERNIQIMRTAYTVSAAASIVLFMLMSFVFTFQGDMFASIVSIVAMYIDVAVFCIAYIILQKKM